MKYSAVLKSFVSLREYVEARDFAGWDPYDGLNSQLFRASPFKYSRLARLAWIQLFKRNPINLKPITLVKPGHNSKGLALFLSGYIQWQNWKPSHQHLEKIKYLVEKIKEIRTPGYSGSCWGYNFDWQARAFFQPKNTPTIVATSYVANALLDAYELLKDKELLSVARSSCDFILKDLNRTKDDYGDFCFSYSPLDNTQVYNASLLGSKLLLRIYTYTKENHLKEAALQSARYCCRGQKADGSWPYGTLHFHYWVDNFHTGFNLECLHDIIVLSGEQSLKPCLDKGLRYYLDNFFTEKGESKFYNNSLYPIDIHAPSQLIIVLSKLGIIDSNKDLVKRVVGWTIQNMRDKKGYFYYQIKPFMSSKTPYMRWAQGWMFYSLSLYLKAFENEAN
ncbi:MAG: delta-aminolevulinic acid dehydratase [Flammeovirgaceae bacterium]